MQPFSPLDLIALAWFAGVWIGYAVTIEWTSYGRGGLNWQMDRYRRGRYGVGRRKRIGIYG